MVEPVDVSFIGYFLPIFAFLLVLIVIYAILQKTKILGDNPTINLFVSFIMASFFIVEIQLVDFVTFTSTWFVVLIMLVFLLFLMLAFMPGKEPLSFLEKGNWFSKVVLVLMIVFFIISSSYIFNWVINWDFVLSGADSPWFGFLLLVVLGAAVSYFITRK